MVRIRLRRVGSRRQPSYRLVAADKECSRDGKFLETLGHYNPRTHPSTVELKDDRIFDWLSKGAQPSDAVVKIFKMVGLADRFERFKGGESVDVLMQEASQVYEKQNTDPRTRRDVKPGQ